MISASVRHIPLGDMLRALELNQKTAVIKFSCEELTGTIVLQEGKIASAQSIPGTYLGEYLVRFDYLTLSQLHKLVKTQTQTKNTLPLGTLAMREGLISESELQAVLGAQVLDTLCAMMGKEWARYTAQVAPIDPDMVGTLDTSAVLMESLRRRDEWLRGRVHPDVVVRLVGDPTQHRLSGEEWEVLAEIDGKKRARSIALKSELPEDQIYHILYDHVQSGLLGPATLPPQDPVVLVLTDSPNVSRMLLVALERERFKVMTFSDVTHVAKSIEGSRPDALIIESERLVEHLKKIRSLNQGKYLPIWGMADKPFKGLWVRTMRLSYLPSDFDESTLVKALSGIRRKNLNFE